MSMGIFIIMFGVEIDGISFGLNKIIELEFKLEIKKLTQWKIINLHKIDLHSNNERTMKT